MAFQTNGPTMLALPAFNGTTRRYILAVIAVFFADAILSRAYPTFTMLTILSPMLVLHGYPWQVITWAFTSYGLLNTALALLSIWYFGASLEDDRGPLWLAEYMAVSAIGGGLLATALSFAPLRGIGPASSAFGVWPMVFALLLAFALRNPNAEMRLYFVLRVKAIYLLYIFLFIAIFQLLVSADRFSPAATLCVALCGWAYLRLAPRRGLRFAASESFYATRNAFYRARRRRAAKKFEVYMRDQGRSDVRVPDEKPSPKDPWVH